MTRIRRKLPVYLHNELCRCDSSGDENDNIEQVTDHSDDEENGNIEEVIDNCDGHVCCLNTSDNQNNLNYQSRTSLAHLIFGFGQSGINNPTNITSITYCFLLDNTWTGQETLHKCCQSHEKDFPIILFASRKDCESRESDDLCFCEVI